jgi:S-adenosylmethionine synthetase
MSSYLFTSESVSSGHPDKLADSISDNILDALLEQDSDSRVAIETLASGDMVVVAGEVSSSASIDIESIVRKRIIDIGYDKDNIGFNGATCKVVSAVSQQSPEIFNGVFNALEGRDDVSRDILDSQGAGDQGIVFGYANSDNTEYFPVAGKISHLLAEKLETIRQEASGKNILLPDAKTQTTIKYENGIPVGIDKILISTQHYDTLSQVELRDFIIAQVIEPVIADYNENLAFGAALTNSAQYLINPAGAWHFGGPGADAGLTGRKIIVDSYNGYARHGGGAYSGKDASKVDRSAAYALRYIAKNVIAAGLAEEIELQVAYAIGSSQPVSIFVDTKNKRSVGAGRIEGIISEVFDLRPAAIIRDLQLKKPIYKHTSTYGHFGRNPLDVFTWEKLDKVNILKEYL